MRQWVAEQARSLGTTVAENSEVETIDGDGCITTADGETRRYDRVLNIAGPWAHRLFDKSGIRVPYQLDLVRGSHLSLAKPCSQAYLLEVPDERRIFFVLLWKGRALLGTTEVRQTLDEPIVYSQEEQTYLMSAYRHYCTNSDSKILEGFAGLRPYLDIRQGYAGRGGILRTQHGLYQCLQSAPIAPSSVA